MAEGGHHTRHIRNQNSPPHEHSLETNSSNPTPSVALASLETQLETLAISDTPIGDHMSSSHIPAQMWALSHFGGTHAETNSALDISPPSALDQESNTPSSGGQAFEVPTLDLQAISEHNPGEQAENDLLAQANTENIDYETKLCPLNDTYVCFGDCPYEHGPLCPFCHMYRINPDKPDLHVLPCYETLVEQSQNLECNICKDYILETDKSFGIQENCNHCFCYKCLDLWRQNKNMANSGACPVCRTPSGYVLDFCFWVTCERSKKRLICCEKKNLSIEDCWQNRHD